MENQNNTYTETQSYHKRNALELKGQMDNVHNRIQYEVKDQLKNLKLQIQKKISEIEDHQLKIKVNSNS